MPHGGREALNPDYRCQVAYIESWYDPSKPRSLLTHRSRWRGCDIQRARRRHTGLPEKGVYAVAEKNRPDRNRPGTVLACAIIRWDITLREALDAVRAGNSKPLLHHLQGAMKAGTASW